MSDRTNQMGPIEQPEGRFNTFNEEWEQVSDELRDNGKSNASTHHRPIAWDEPWALQLIEW